MCPNRVSRTAAHAAHACRCGFHICAGTDSCTSAPEIARVFCANLRRRHWIALQCIASRTARTGPRSLQCVLGACGYSGGSHGLSCVATRHWRPESPTEVLEAGDRAAQSQSQSQTQRSRSRGAVTAQSQSQSRRTSSSSIAHSSPPDVEAGLDHCVATRARTLAAATRARRTNMDVRTPAPTNAHARETAHERMCARVFGPGSAVAHAHESSDRRKAGFAD